MRTKNRRLATTPAPSAAPTATAPSATPAAPLAPRAPAADAGSPTLAMQFEVWGLRLLRMVRTLADNPTATSAMLDASGVAPDQAGKLLSQFDTMSTTLADALTLHRPDPTFPLPPLQFRG